MQYTLSRGVSGGATPAAEIIADTLACVALTDSRLAKAQVERDFVRGLAAQPDIADHSPAEARKPLLEQLLEGATPISCDPPGHLLNVTQKGTIPLLRHKQCSQQYPWRRRPS